MQDGIFVVYGIFIVCLLRCMCMVNCVRVKYGVIWGAAQGPGTFSLENRKEIEGYRRTPQSYTLVPGPKCFVSMYSCTFHYPSIPIRLRRPAKDEETHLRGEE